MYCFANKQQEVWKRIVSKKIIKQFRCYFVVYFDQENIKYIVHNRDDHISPTSNICRFLKGESISSVRV